MSRSRGRAPSGPGQNGCRFRQPSYEVQTITAGEDYKPVFVPLRATAIRLLRTLLYGSSDLPGSLTERAAPSPLFGLAPRGVCPAIRITPDAVRSYRTFSPLPAPKRRRFVFCGTFRESPFEGPPPAVSRHAALWRPDFPLAPG